MLSGKGMRRKTAFSGFEQLEPKDLLTTLRILPTDSSTDIGAQQGDVGSPTLRETSVGGVQRLSHEWRFDLPADTQSARVVFDGTSSPSDEAFWVSYSFDNRNYRTMMTVSPDLAPVQTRLLPSPSGTSLWVAIRDSKRSNDTTPTTVNVNELYVEVEVPDNTPPAPDPPAPDPPAPDPPAPNPPTPNPPTDVSTISVFAFGDVGVEQMEVLVDGFVVWTQTVTTSWEEYQITSSDLDIDRVRIRFTNDLRVGSVDRNLHVDRIVVNGQSIETESDEVFSTGTWRGGTLEPGFGRGQSLHVNGYFEYTISDDVPTTPDPPAPDPPTPDPPTPDPPTPDPPTPDPPTPPPTSSPTAPTTLFATPSNATVSVGQAVQISGTFADANGADNLRLLEIRISDGQSQQPRCFIRYDVDTDFIRLWDDRIGGFADVGPAGQSIAASNENCGINTSTTFVDDVDATSMRMTSEIVFTSAISGERNIWLRAYDYSGRWSERVDHGDIVINNGGGNPPPVSPPPPVVPPVTPPSTEPQAPVTVSVSPVDATVSAGSQFEVRSTFSDANGTDDLRLLEIRISQGTSTQPRCFLRYDVTPDRLKLWNDDITGFETIGAPGASGVRDNGLCSVRAADVTIRDVDATTVEMTAKMTLNNGLSGPHNVWLRAMDKGGLWSERTDHGDVYVRVNAPTLPPAPPPPPTTNPGDPNVPTPSGGGPSNSGTRASISDGYTDQQSYDQYSLQQVYINANSTRNNARIDLYDESARVVDSVFFDARPQQPRNANPVADGFGYDASFTYNVAGLPSGVYWWNNSIPFVVKDTNRTSKIRVVLATNTMAAYTCSGGRNMYGCGSYSEDKVSFNRQFQSVRHGLPDGSNIRRETGGVSNPFFWWLEQEIGNLGTTYGVIADRDLEDPSSLHGADVVVLVGHSEYWTRNARLTIDQFVDNGGNMAVFSGNTMWWQSRYEGDQLVVYKRASEDPVSNPLLETINWNHPSLEYPIFHSIGADFKHGGYIEMDPPNNAPGSFNGYKITQANSPILEGVNVSNGDIIRWDSDYIFSEYDGAPISGFDGNGYPIIDNNVLGFHKVEMIGYDHAYRSVPGFGMLMAFQRTPSSGYVINTNTMQWPYEMTKSPDRDDLQRISFNILDKLLNDEEIFSPSVARSPTAAEFEELSFVPGTLSQPNSESTDNSDTTAVDRVITDLLAGELEQSAGRQSVQPSWLELYRPSERDLGTLLFERLSEADDDVEEHGKLASLF